MCLKYVILIFLNLNILIACQEIPLEAPSYRFFKVTAIRPPGILVDWHGVSSGHPNPVIGYKVRVWQVATDKNTEYGLINGEEYPGVIESSKPYKPFRINETLNIKPKEITIYGVESRQALINNLDYNVLYEVRILAFKANEDGPMTPPRWVKILEYPNMVIQRQTDACFVSLRSSHDSSQTKETYPYYYNSYF